MTSLQILGINPLSLVSSVSAHIVHALRERWAVQSSFTYEKAEVHEVHVTSPSHTHLTIG